MPREMIDVPALERGGDVQRQLEVQAVRGDAVRPQRRPEALQHEADGQRDEGAGGESGHRLAHQHAGEIGGEGDQRRRNGEHRRRDQQHAPRPNTTPSQVAIGPMHICPTVAAVVIQAPSSKPACTAPRRSASPKVVMRVNRVEITEPEQHRRDPDDGASDRRRRRRIVMLLGASRARVRAHCAVSSLPAASV